MPASGEGLQGSQADAMSSEEDYGSEPMYESGDEVWGGSDAEMDEGDYAEAASPVPAHRKVGGWPLMGRRSRRNA